MQAPSRADSPIGSIREEGEYPHPQLGNVHSILILLRVAPLVPAILLQSPLEEAWTLDQSPPAILTWPLHQIGAMSLWRRSTEEGMRRTNCEEWKRIAIFIKGEPNILKLKQATTKQNVNRAK